MKPLKNRKAEQIKAIIQALKGNVSELQKLSPLRPAYVIEERNGIRYEYGTDKLADPPPNCSLIIVSGSPPTDE